MFTNPVKSSDWGWHNVTISTWSNEHLLTDLKPHTTYKVRLLASNELGRSNPTPEELFTTELEGKYQKN